MTKTAKVLFVVMLALFVSGFFFPPMFVFALLVAIVFLVYMLVRRLTMPKEELQKIREENAAIVAEAKAKQEQGEAELEKIRAAEKKRKADDRRAVSAVLISTESRKSGAFGRALVGDALFGPMGAIVGAASAKSKATKATFSVKYASGRTGVETVAIGSQRFNELSALLHK